MNTFLVILSIVMMSAGVAFCIWPRGWSALCAFVGMLLMWLSDHTLLDPSQLWFWGAAALIVMGIAVLLPWNVATSRRGVGYVVVATVAGLLVGVLISPNVMVLGGITGAFCGALAYSRTPRGANLHFPSRQFVNYLCAKALPPVITLSVVALTLLSLFTSGGNKFLM